MSKEREMEKAKAIMIPHPGALEEDRLMLVAREDIRSPIVHAHVLSVTKDGDEVRMMEDNHENHISLGEVEF